MNLYILFLLILVCQQLYGAYPDTFYEVTLVTGKGAFAGTDANIFLQLWGTKGAIGRVMLPTTYGQIKSGSTVKLNIDFKKDVGNIDKIRIGHDNSGFGAGWLLNEVHVEHELSGIVRKFYVRRWLDDDRAVGRFLNVEAERPNLESCGIASKPRVVNGKTALKGQWPWQTQIRIRDTLMPHHCGATLIHPEYILTAAHCVDEIKDATKYIITLGEHILQRDEGTEQVFAGVEIIQHQEYSRNTFENDIALIKLHKPAKLNAYVKLACLPEHGVNLKEDQQCYISGWGNLYGGGPTPAYLQHASVPSTSNKKCDTYMRPISPFHTGIKSNMLCAGGNGKVGCHGDSGGPLVCPNKLTSRYNVEGAVSWGSPTCSFRNTFTVFARVSQYVDWISANIHSRYS